ncbi:hypothetical protein SLA2020_427570 [Shorea laevis]
MQLGQGVRNIPGCCNSQIFSRQTGIRRRIILTNAIHYTSLITKPKSKVEAKLDSALKHSLAERDRRKRINKQFEKLRSILPNLTKMDKASVLTEAVWRVRDLQKKVEGLKAASHGRMERVLPGEADELSLVYFENNGGLVKATFSCDDRRDLVPDLTKALQSVKGQVVRTEMVVVGGRIKGELWVKGVSGNEVMQVLKRALQMVVARPNSSDCAK